MTPNEFRNELKKPSGCYLFCGEEDYLKRHYLSALRKAVIEEGDVFNHIVLNSDNYSPERLFGAVEALPMMSDKKLIELTSVDIAGMTETELDELSNVLSEIGKYEYNVVLIYTEPFEFSTGNKKQPSKEYSCLKDLVKIVSFDRESPARLASWVTKHFTAELIVAPPDEVKLLIDRCSCDMYTLASEIDKLSCYLKAHGRERLTAEDIITVCGERKEIAAFDLANAIIGRNGRAAFSVLHQMKREKEKPEIILSGVSRSIGDMLIVKTLLNSGMNTSEISKKSGIHEYRVSLYAKSASGISIDRLKELSERCYEADKLIKSTSLDSYTVIERLVAEVAK